MKRANKLLQIACALLALCLASCQPYDDTDINKRIDSIDARLTELESLVKKINSDIILQSKLVADIKDRLEIKSVVTLSDGSGIVITFTDDSSYEIRNGKDGIDGLPGIDATAPVISVRKDTDGQYYWTVNGEFITDSATGNKIPATMMTPKIEVQGDKFMLSFDNGSTWIEIGTTGGITATGNCGIEKVDDSDPEVVTFHMSDGSTIVIPRVQEFALIIDNLEIPVTPGEMTAIQYRITGADEGTVVDAIATGGFEVVMNQTIIPGDNSAGMLLVSIPNPLPMSGKLFVFAVNSKGISSTRIISFEEGTFYTDAQDDIPVEVEGGEVTIFISSNYDYDIAIQDGTSWISIKERIETRTVRNETVTFSVSKNYETERSAYIYIQGPTSTFKSFKISQKGVTVDETDGYKGPIDDWEDDGSIDF